MHNRTGAASVVSTLGALLLGLLTIAPASAAEDDIPRLANGKPDLSGNYDIASLTPFERNKSHGDQQFMTVEEAEKIEKMAAAGMAAANKASDPNREAPPAGGDGSPGAAGAVVRRSSAASKRSSTASVSL